MSLRGRATQHLHNEARSAEFNIVEIIVAPKSMKYLIFESGDCGGYRDYEKTSIYGLLHVFLQNMIVYACLRSGILILKFEICKVNRMVG